MKAAFQFHAYDVWAYLISGAVVLAALLLNVAFVGPHDPVVEFVSKLPNPTPIVIGSIGFVTGSYLLGQLLIAGVSVVLFEDGLVRLLLRHPADVLLSRGSASLRIKVLRIVGGRCYAPLSRLQRDTVIAKAKAAYAPGEEPTPSDIVEVASSHVRRNSDIAQRLDQSRNQYALARNFALASLIAAFLSFYGGAPIYYECGFLVAAPLALVRFLKFYSTYNSQILRAFLSEEPMPFNYGGSSPAGGQLLLSPP